MKYLHFNFIITYFVRQLNVNDMSNWNEDGYIDDETEIDEGDISDNAHDEMIEGKFNN